MINKSKEILDMALGVHWASRDGERKLGLNVTAEPVSRILYCSCVSFGILETATFYGLGYLP